MTSHKHACTRRHHHFNGRLNFPGKLESCLPRWLSFSITKVRHNNTFLVGGWGTPLYNCPQNCPICEFYDIFMPANFCKRFNYIYINGVWKGLSLMVGEDLWRLQQAMHSPATTDHSTQAATSIDRASKDRYSIIQTGSTGCSIAKLLNALIIK